MVLFYYFLSKLRDFICETRYYYILIKLHSFFKLFFDQTMRFYSIIFFIKLCELCRLGRVLWNVIPLNSGVLTFKVWSVYIFGRNINDSHYNYYYYFKENYLSVS